MADEETEEEGTDDAADADADAADADAADAADATDAADADAEEGTEESESSEETTAEEEHVIDPSVQVVFKSAKPLVSLKYVGAPPPGYIYTSNFDNLWSVTFSLSTSNYKPAKSDNAATDEGEAEEDEVEAEEEEAEADTEATALYSSLSRDGIAREEK